MGVSVCHIFSIFNFFRKKMTKNSKKKEQQAGDQPRASKRKIQQSAPLASGVSIPEKAKKPKGVAAETAILSVSSPPAEVAKGTSASNVAEEEWKLPALPKYAAVPREVFGAGAVPVEESVAVEAIKAQGVAGEKLEEAEDKDKEDDNDDNDYGSGDDEEEEDSGNEKSEYAPAEEGSEGTVNLADDAVAPDNLPDKVKPVQKVSSLFDLPILLIAKTLLVKQGKKGNMVHDGDDYSIILLTDDEAKEATLLKSQKKKVLATKSPPAGSTSKVGTSASSEDALMMIKGCQELFFNLPWKNYVSVFVPFTFLFS
jgi:hypothetical protein